ALARMARAHDEFVGRLVGPRLLALGRLAPGRDWMTTARGPAFTTAVRMVDRVHGDAAIVRTLAAPAGPASLAVVDVAVIRVGNGTDGGDARTVHQALLAGVQPQDRHALVATDQLGVGPGGAGDLTALARLELHIVDDRADRHGRERH